MQARAFILAAWIAATAWSCAHAADVVFPPGSKIGLVPPVGFSPSTHFHGFEDRANQAAMLLLEMPAQAYAEITKNMTAKALKSQGVAVDKQETLALSFGSATLVTARQQEQKSKLRKWILAGAAPDLTALVTVIVPETASSIYPEAAIRAALATVAVRSSIPIEEQIGLLPFRIDELAGLRAVRVVGPNTVFLTDGPKNTFEANEQPMLIISAAAGGPEDPPQRDNFARNLFSSLGGFKDVRIVGTDSFRIGGLQTHQLMAEAKDPTSGANLKLVQWLRFGSGAYVRFLGVASADTWPDAFPRFRAVRDGVGPRQ